MRLKKGNVERIAETEVQIAKLKAAGYRELSSSDVTVSVSSVREPEKNLNEKSLSELKALAKAKGLEGCSSLSKNELLAVLKDVV